MPLHARKIGASWFLIFVFIFAAFAQAPQTPSAAEVMRERINKVKALIALKSYSAAIYELEGIRRETNEASVTSVVQVMLMNCYLEQSDYKRAQTLLTELYNAQKAGKPNANYYAVAAQVVKGARNQLDRYKSLGLTVSDPSLPSNAVTDLDRMRETVESVVDQAKTLGANKKDAPVAMALLEEATNARGSLARDDYDAKRWKEEVADARESLMNSRSVVNAVDDSALTTDANTLAANTNPGAPKSGEPSAPASIVAVSGPPPAAPPSGANPAAKNDGVKTEPAKPIETGNQADNSATVKTPETAKPEATNQNSQTQNTENANTNAGNPTRTRRVAGNDSPNTASTESANNSQNSSETPADAPMVVGSLVEYATEKVSPTYPPAARTVRMTGMVRVEVLVDEKGSVSVEKTSGPSLLQRAAHDAVKKWKFKPFTRDGQPVKAKGFVNFNFNL